MRRVAVSAAAILVLICVGLFALGQAYQSGWFHGRLPPDSRASNESQAGDVAFSVASNAGCGDFDGDEAPHYVSDDTWQFDCMIGDVPYGIFVYGSDRARSVGLAALQADGSPYVAEAYYAVTTIPTEVAAGQALTASPPPASVMDPFR
jgi:hypothetical protein